MKVRKCGKKKYGNMYIQRYGGTDLYRCEDMEVSRQVDTEKVMHIGHAGPI